MGIQCVVYVVPYSLLLVIVIIGTLFNVVSKYAFVFLTVPSGPPRDVSVNALTSSSINIRWSPPLPVERNGIIRGYMVTVTDVNQTLKFSLENTSLTVSDLHPYSAYDVTIAAVTIGVGVRSREYLIITLEDGKSTLLTNSMSSKMHEQLII